MIIVLSILALVATCQELLLSNEIQQNKLELLQYDCQINDSFKDVRLYYIIEAEEDFIQYKKDFNQIEIENTGSLSLLKKEYGFNQEKQCRSYIKRYRPIDRIISYNKKSQEQFLQGNSLDDVLEILKRIVIETNNLFGDKRASLVLDYIIDSLSTWSKDAENFLDLVQKKKISDEQKQQAQQAYHNCEHIVKLVTKRLYEKIKQSNLNKNVLLKQKLRSRKNHKRNFDQDLLLDNEIQQNKLELLQYECIRERDYTQDMQKFLVLEAEEDFRKYIKDINSQKLKVLQSITKSLSQDYGYNNKYKLKKGEKYSSFRNKKNEDPYQVLEHIVTQTDYLIAEDEELSELIDQISFWESDVNFFLDIVQKMQISDEEKQQGKFAYHNCNNFRSEQVTKSIYGSIITVKN